MKKKFRILSLFGVTTALLVAMLSSISAFAAPSGAITGTITVDKTWYSNVAAATNDVLIKVTDADANVTTAGSGLTAGATGTEKLFNLAQGSAVTLMVATAKTPIVGTPLVCDAADAIGACDNEVDSKTISVTVVDAAAGLVRLTNIDAAVGGGAAIAMYWNYSDVDFVKTTLTSTQEPNGNTIWLKETGKDTGIFTAIVDLTADATPTDFGTLTTVYKGESGAIAAGVASAAFNATVDHLDEAVLSSAGGLNGAWCVKSTDGLDAALTDNDCAQAVNGVVVAYVPGTLAINSNTGVASATASVKFTPTGALNELIEINMPYDVVTGTSSTTALSNTVNDNGLKALNLNTIKAEYSDATPTSGATAVKVSDTASVETTGATFANILPVTATATQSTQPTISGTVTDTGGSGIDVSTVMMNIDTDGGGTLAVGEQNLATVTTGADGDNTVTFTYTAVLSVNNPHNFVIEATDMAGNISYTDATPAAVGEDAQVGPADAADWHQFTIDSTPATFSSAQTGKYWDSTITVPAEASNKATSVVLTFNENMDGTTVQASDFLVDGVQPVTAFHTTKAKTKVYLELGTAIAANKKPVVKMGAAGAVSDLAGNTTNTGTVTASDAIAPTFTVTLDATLTKKNVIVTVAADEPISGAPIINVGALKGGGGTSLPVTNSNLSSQVATSTSWTGKYTATAAYEGTVGVVVTGNDMNGNSGTAGSNTMGAVTLTANQCLVGHVDYTTTCKFSSTKNISFTSDTTMNDATFTSGNVALNDATGANVTDIAPYVTATFDEAVTVTAATFDLKAATTPADVLAGGALSSDGKKWIYKAADLTVGSVYKVNLTYADAAGNEDKAIDALLTVKSVTDTSVPLNPGSNLVSFPVDPSDTAINTVITSADVTAVSTYDNGSWITATRSGDTLSGALTTIDSSRGYWVTTTSFTPIKTAVAKQSASDTPPTVSVEKGWNLLSVINITSTNASIGNTLAADTYLGSISWVTAYSYSPVTDIWSKITPNTFATVTVGTGYWVYADAAGTLVA